MSDLVFEAIVLKIEANKMCKVYLEKDETKRPIVGVFKEKVTSDKKQRLKIGDKVKVKFTECDPDRCMVLQKIISVEEAEQHARNAQRRKRKFKR